MDCPRCGISVFSDHSNCRSCGWQLSQPYEGKAGAALPPSASYSFTSSGLTQTFASASAPNEPKGEPLIQTAADAFALSPPGRAQRVAHSRRRKPARGRRAAAAATLPEEARWFHPRQDWEAPPRFEVIETPLAQSSFDFQGAEQEAELLAARAAAPVELRCRAGLLDATLILLAAAVFLGLFVLLSGPAGMSFARRDLLVFLLAGFALAVLYFGLFTLLGGRTPGMQYYGLRVASFAGAPPATAASLRRAFGYGVSTGSLLLGFLWALVDERHLTWHDHISKTFLTNRKVL